MNFTNIKRYLRILAQIMLGGAILSVGEYYLDLETLPLRLCAYTILGGFFLNVHGVIEAIEEMIRIWKES